jgi:DNA-binding MarR family transcriptional regulator
MFQDLAKHLRPYNVDLIDLAIIELIGDGVSELREISESLGKGRENIQYAYARLESLQRKGWLSEPVAKPNCKRYKLRKITPEGRKRMKKLKALIQDHVCGGVGGSVPDSGKD